jgi:adenylate cyclase
MDRRQAIAQARTLPERSRGAALFADISGFTPLTEALTLVHGTRYGAEELSRHLSRIYDALIAPVDCYGGSIVYFSGDAITCWFGDCDHLDETNPSARAVAAALAMQDAVQSLEPVLLPGRDPIRFGVKISITTGEVRRFVVGEPQVQLLDTLSGQTIDQLATAESLIRRGEIIIDAATLAAVPAASVNGWRSEGDRPDAQRFAVIGGLREAIPPTPWSIPPTLTDAQVLPWLLPDLREQYCAGASALYAELRPVVAVFLRFSGIDFAHDPDCGAQLDQYIRHVQGVLATYGGNIVQLTIGDKGSYLYIAFGAPIAHEDDPQRAVAAALELRSTPSELAFVHEVQIGISLGTMHAGMIGGSTSRSYGVMGDEVNLAARLMQHARPGEVLGSGRIYNRTSETAAWQVLPPLHVKGKDQPVTLARLIGRSGAPHAGDTFSGVLVGREAELDQLVGMLQPLEERRFAGVAYIHGEPGIGKSRMAHELQERVRQRFDAIWLNCPPDRILRRSLYPFRAFFQEYFEQSPDTRNHDHFDHIFDKLLESAERRPELTQGRSFLAALVDLHTPGSAYEQSNPKERFEGSITAIKAFMEAISSVQPVVMQIESGSGLDMDSRQLVRFLLRHMQAHSWAMLITSRDPQHALLSDFEFDSDTAFGVVELKELELDAIREMAREQLGGAVTEAAVRFLADKTGGNPLFIEQLILDMRERGMLVQGVAGAWELTGDGLEEVPTSISGIFIARIDRLPAAMKALLQVASVLGQTVEVRVLAHMLHDERLDEKIQEAVAQSIWTLTESGVLHFQQSLLRDTIYETQTQGRLQELHGRAGRTLEHVHADSLRIYAPEIAYHYGMANDAPKERAYARMAGEAAAERYAGADAINYLSRALKLTPVSHMQERYELLRAREEVYGLRGDRAAQLGDLNALFELANQLGIPRQRAEVAMRRANYAEVTGDYLSAIRHAEHAVSLARQHGVPQIEAAGLLAWGRAQGWQAHYASARRNLQTALDLARTHHLHVIETASLRNLGILAFAQGDYTAAEDYQTEALTISRARGDQRGEGAALTNLARIAHSRSDHTGARAYQETALRLSRETGDRQGENSVLNLTQVAFSEDDPAKKRAFHDESLRLSRDIGNRRGEATALYHLGMIALDEGEYGNGQALLEQAVEIASKIGFRRGEIRARTALARLYFEYHESEKSLTALEQINRSLDIAESVGARPEQAAALIVAGCILLANLRTASARQSFEKALILYQEMEQTSPALEALSGLIYATQLQDEFGTVGALLPELMNGLPTADLHAMIDPLRFYMNCFSVLHAMQDARASAVLEDAYRIIQTRAARFTEPTQRLNYLESSRSRRAIIAARAWNEQG